MGDGTLYCSDKMAEVNTAGWTKEALDSYRSDLWRQFATEPEDVQDRYICIAGSSQTFEPQSSQALGLGQR